MGVWVVEQGEYSDYRVVGIFSTQENAEKIAKLVAAEGSSYKATVTEWPIDPGIEDLSFGRKQFLVVMGRDGSTDMVESLDFDSYRLSPEYVFQGTKGGLSLRMTVWASDETHAVKIVNETRAEFIASGFWDRELRRLK